MTISDLGNLGEFVSSIAILVSLIYLAIQVRHNTQQLDENGKALRRGEINVAMKNWSRWRGHMISDPSLSEMIERGQSDPASVTPADIERMVAYASEMLWIQYQTWSRVKEGFFERDLWSRNNLQMVRMWALMIPPGQTAWAQSKAMFHPDFIAEIESKDGGQDH